MSCIKKGRTTFYGVIEIDGKFACEKCKTINPEGKLVCHMDGRDFYKNVYNCSKCGNVLEIENKRDRQSRAYWS